MHTIELSTIQDFTANYTGPLFDAVLCDAPYELDFMGKHWDRSGVAFDPAVWRGVYDLLKPGAFLFAFGGTRTYHRMTCAIEDAGFEVRDCIMYVYGSGFPKSHDISKAIDREAGAEREVVGRYTRPNGSTVSPNGKNTFADGGFPNTHTESAQSITAPATPDAQTWHGYGTAIKPAWEPVGIAMKPIDGTFANNALVHGVAGLNIDGGRVDTGENTRRENNKASIGYGGSNIPFSSGSTKGRFPANLIHDGSDEVLAGFPETTSGVFERRKSGSQFLAHARDAEVSGHQGGDSGSASRFFYTAKAHKSERNAGLDVDAVTTDDGRLTPIDNPYQRGKTKRQNHHPTVKPLELTKYLATLILPPQQGTPRRILVPFAGSGSEMIGAMLAGWDEIVGVEMSPEYVEIAQARMAWWQTVSGQLRTGDIARIMEYAYPQDYVEDVKVDDFSELPLFGGRVGCD